MKSQEIHHLRQGLVQTSPSHFHSSICLFCTWRDCRLPTSPLLGPLSCLPTYAYCFTPPGLAQPPLLPAPPPPIPLQQALPLDPLILRRKRCRVRTPPASPPEAHLPPCCFPASLEASCSSALPSARGPGLGSLPPLILLPFCTLSFCPTPILALHPSLPFPSSLPLVTLGC